MQVAKLSTPINPYIKDFIKGKRYTHTRTHT